MGIDRKRSALHAARLHRRPEAVRHADAGGHGRAVAAGVENRRGSDMKELRIVLTAIVAVPGNDGLVQAERTRLMVEASQTVEQAALDFGGSATLTARVVSVRGKQAAMETAAAPVVPSEASQDARGHP